MLGMLGLQVKCLARNDEVQRLRVLMPAPQGGDLATWRASGGNGVRRALPMAASCRAPLAPLFLPVTRIAAGWRLLAFGDRGASAEAGRLEGLEGLDGLEGCDRPAAARAALLFSLARPPFSLPLMVSLGPAPLGSFSGPLPPRRKAE